MPLEAPKLDDRTFEDLLKEARERIVRYNRDWTDFNESDPGMTLVQLFAWFTETMLYQMNRLPELNYIKFLQLLGLEREPTRPATAHLTFLPKLEAQSSETQITIDSITTGTRVQAEVPQIDEPLVFETERGFDMIPWPLRSIMVFDGSRFTPITDEGIEAVSPFQPFGPLPQVGSALYLGFEPSPVELDRPPGQSAPKSQRYFPQQMRFRVILPQTTENRVLRSGPIDGGSNNADLPLPNVKLQWEYKKFESDRHWRPLDVFSDSSRAFNNEGDLVIQGPAQIIKLTLPRVPEARFWIRCRLASGEFFSDSVPQIEGILPNTVESKQLTTERDELVGISDGTPDQEFQLSRTPVFHDDSNASLDLRVIDSQGAEPKKWERVEEFFESNDRDRHYVLNHNSGRLQFGDGKKGDIPVAGAEIVAFEYRHGGGSQGNVGPRTMTTLLSNFPTVDRVTNFRGAAGGKEEQSVEELKVEAPRKLRSRDRAMSADDFAHSAEQVDGVAHAVAIARHHPDYPEVPVPGAVTVVIVPKSAERPPRPTTELLGAVAKRLDERRLITTELYVLGPQFKAIRVEATVEANPSVAPGQVKTEVIEAIDDLLNPFGEPAQERRKKNTQKEKARNEGESKGDASEGNGSSTHLRLGRTFYPTRLFEVILDIKAVRAVSTLKIFLNGNERNFSEEIPLSPSEMIYGENPEITVRPADEN